MVVEIDNAAERQALTSDAQVEVIWVVRGEQDLLEVTRQLNLPQGSLYAWVATESSLSRKVRRVLLDEFTLDEAAVKAAGYWRADGSDEE